MSGERNAFQEPLAVYATDAPEKERVPPGYKRTEVGVLPEDWEVCSLDEAAEFLDGRRRPVRDSDRAKMRGIYPYYGASGIVDYVNDYLFDEDLVLLGEDGENILSRNCRLAFHVAGKIWVNNHAHVLRPKAGSDVRFLAEYLESLDYDQYNTGTAQPKLNKRVCARIPVVAPPLPEQRAIAAALSDVDGLISSLDKLISKKRAVKIAAMQQLLTGKQRLPGFSGEWETKRLGDLLTIRHGKSQRNVVADDGIYPVLATGGEIGRSNTFLYDKPSVLIGRKGTIDRPQYQDSPFWTVDTLFYSEIGKAACPKLAF